MGLFDLFSKKKTVEITRDEYYKIAQSLPEYMRLKTLIGRQYATYIVGMIWEKFPKTKNPLTHSPSSLQNFTGQVSTFLTLEKRNIDSRKVYVEQLWNHAVSGSLRSKLLPVSKSKGNPMQEIRTACDWMVSSGMNASFKGIVRTILYENCVLNKSVPPLGRNDHFIVDAHKKVVPGMSKEFRNITLGVNYPSSVGGRYLLRWFLKDKDLARWPDQGNAKWEDYALFYFGAIGSVQPFRDGNKRISRLAYAITLLKGDRQFKPFSYGVQNDLLRMSMG